MLSMSAAGVLFWGKKSRPAVMMFMLRLLVLLHAVAPAVIRCADWGTRCLAFGEQGCGTKEPNGAVCFSVAMQAPA